MLSDIPFGDEEDLRGVAARMSTRAIKYAEFVTVVTA